MGIVQGASVGFGAQQATTGGNGRYQIAVPSSRTQAEVLLHGLLLLQTNLDIEGDQVLDMTLKQGASVDVNANLGAMFPDPATQGYSQGELLQANPGRPGAPVSIPGRPVETASGGIKAPQYPSPGIDGDHGEPIAQFL